MRKDVEKYPMLDPYFHEEWSKHYGGNRTRRKIGVVQQVRIKLVLLTGLDLFLRQ